MSSFSAPLDVRLTDSKTRGRVNAVVLRPFEYRTADTAVFVEKGFITDFASVPRIGWALLPPLGRYTKAAVVHDKLYRRHETQSGQVTRREADRIFYGAMRDSGVKWVTARTMWLFVRLFGGRSWRLYR